MNTFARFLVSLLCIGFLNTLAAQEPAVISDAALQQQIEARFAGIDALSETRVAVEGGVVTLSGEVADASYRELAESMVQKSPGVVAVENQLLFGGDLSERFGEAFERSWFKIQWAVGYLPLFALSVVLVVVFFLLGSWVSGLSAVRRLSGSNRFLQEIMRQCVKVAIGLIGILIALDLLDATALVGAVFGAAGVAGLAIGFAFKDLIENYVASMLLSLRRPFSPNDFVHIGEHAGRVVSLNTRSTLLMTLDGNHLRLPNALVFKSVILNFSRNAERRFDFAVGVGTDEDLVAAQRLGVETLKGLEGILTDPQPWAAITELAASSVTVQFYAWVDQTKFSFAKVKGNAIRQVKTVLEDAGMDLPEPIHRVRLEQGGVEDLISKPASGSAKPQPSRKSVEDDADLDLDNERALDRQVEEELRKSDSSNLLLEESPLE